MPHQTPDTGHSTFEVGRGTSKQTPLARRSSRGEPDLPPRTLVALHHLVIREST